MSRRSRRAGSERGSHPCTLARAAACATIAAIVAATGCAAPHAGVSPTSGVIQPAPVDYAAQLTALVESYQPADPYLPNRWSQAVRTAFLYSGAQRMFAAGSPAIRAYLGESDAHRPEDFVLAPLGELPDASPDLAIEARRFLDALESEQLLLHLHEIAEPCRLIAPPPFRGFNAPLASQETYEQGAIRNLATACCLRMRFAAEDGRPVVLLGAFASGMQLGRTLCGRPMLLSLMNAQVTQNRVMREALLDARAGRLDADTCRSLLVETGRSRLPSPAIFLEMERIIGLDAIDRYFDRKTHEQAAASEGTVSIADLSRTESLAVFETAIDRCRAVLARETNPTGPHPPPPAPPPPATSGTLDPAANHGPFAAMLTPPPLEMPPGRSDPDGLLATLVPPVGPMVMGVQEHACIRAGLITGLLLELHRAEHGAYPRSLADLAVADVAIALPPDPYAPDRPLGYRPPDPAEGPSSLGGYTLYSVGADRVDDGGTPSRRHNRESLYPPPRSAGSDYVIVGASLR